MMVTFAIIGKSLLKNFCEVIATHSCLSNVTLRGVGDRLPLVFPFSFTLETF